MNTDRVQPLKRGAVVGCLLLFATGYPAGYVLARSTHQIVHARAYTWDAHGHQVTSEHQVRAGDGKWSPLPGLCAVIFAPLRGVEFVAWQLLEPEGRPFGLP
jgi:hypothetical protein